MVGLQVEDTVSTVSSTSSGYGSQQRESGEDLFCFHPTCYTTTIAAHCSKNSSSLFSEMIPRQTPDGHHELGSNL